MTFEEFFKKKRIDLAALQAADSMLFSEFKTHFAQMGEKSFDHTKKYWFNKLRLQYHLAPGQKPEKIHFENPLAEQTVTESLTEALPPPSVGFKPRFKAGMAGKPIVDTGVQTYPPLQNSATSTPGVDQAAASHDQHPEFQLEKEPMQARADDMPGITDTPEHEPTVTNAPKPGFKPRFSMKMVSPKPEGLQQENEETAEPESSAPSGSEKPADDLESKPAYKPRFNIKNIKPQPPQE